MNNLFKNTLSFHSLLLLIMPLNVFAQQDDTPKTSISVDSVMNVGLAKPTTNSSENNSVSDITVENIISEIGTLTSELKGKQDSISWMKDTIKSLCQDTILLHKEIKELQEEKNKVESDRNGLKVQIDNWGRKLSSLDQVIYKQCLLYPLEGKYDPENITEAITTIETIQDLIESPSNQFVQYKKTYFPLLKGYEQYNNQIINLIESHILFLKALDWKIGVRKEKFMNELKQLPYYSECYLKKDIPPFESITYLDDAIDKYINILKKEGNVKTDIEELLQSLRPKK